MALSGVRQEYLYICVQKMQEEGYAITETCDILNLDTPIQEQQRA